MNFSTSERLRGVLSSLMTSGDAPLSASQFSDSFGEHRAPFVTISREAGAGGISLGHALVTRLNARPGATEPHPWQLWDQELVDRVSLQHHLPEDVVKRWEDQKHAWFEDFLASLVVSTTCDDFKVYRRVALTIRLLARVGHAVIIGRGGVFVTAGMPGGIHVRLVAPLSFRIEHMAKQMNVSAGKAAAMVKEVDRTRTAFYKRDWPTKLLLPETFTLTFNMAQLDEQEIVDCLVPIILHKNGVPAVAGAAR